MIPTAQADALLGRLAEALGRPVEIFFAGCGPAAGSAEPAVTDIDPRLLAVHALAESNERGPAVIEQLARWPDDAGGRPDLAGLLGIAAFCTGDFRRAIGFLSTPVQELRAQGRMSLLAEALAIRSWAEIYLGVFDVASSADEASSGSTRRCTNSVATSMPCSR